MASLMVNFDMTSLFDPFQLSDLTLPNRLVMAPMTRSRATADGIPIPIMAEYYAQRASAGLLISEATNVSPMSNPFERAPGLFTSAQTDAWKPITAAVHNAGGRIFAQLWHGGRIGAKGVLDWREPLSPSGFNDDMESLHVWASLANGHYVRISATPSREMTREEVRTTIREYQTAAKNAMAAGFDGIEIHAANGYLPHQFLSPHVNRRTDEYGGSVENRARFLTEIIEAISDVMPPSRIGVRLSPYTVYNSALDDDPVATYTHVGKMLETHGISYINISDVNGWYGAPDLDKILHILHGHFTGPVIANGGITIESAAELVNTNRVPLIGFGRYFLANPDLVERIKRGAPLNEVIERRLYAGGADGYTDYPVISDF